VNGSAGSAGHYPLWSDEPVRRNVDQLEALIFIANQEATVLSKSLNCMACLLWLNF
jgi:hypothetical protein